MIYASEEGGKELYLPYNSGSHYPASLSNASCSQINRVAALNVLGSSAYGFRIVDQILLYWPFRSSNAIVNAQPLRERYDA
jgi:hypothetical protein